jgi:low temperature requirement protein LtrA
MRARQPAEAHRAATPLELFFDLCFVVAVSLAAAGLHHALVENHVADGVLGYLMVFFAIWWAWVNFTAFASAYDTDDGLYRVTTLVQIAGALVLAAGVPAALDRRDFQVITCGYVIMRLAMVAQWLRAARSDPERRGCALRFAGGIALVQLGWVVRLALPGGWGLLGFAVLAVAELAVPVWAERAGPTTWHPGHLAERYGLFTLIVLGEVVLAATSTIQEGLSEGEHVGALLGLAGAGLVIVFSMWGCTSTSRPRAGSPRCRWCCPGATGTTRSLPRWPRWGRAWRSRWTTTPGTAGSTRWPPVGRRRCRWRCTCSACGCCGFAVSRVAGSARSTWSSR